MKKKYKKRTKFYIDKKFQNRFILSYIEIIMLSIILTIILSLTYTYFSTSFGSNSYSILYMKIVDGKEKIIEPINIVLPIILLSSLITVIISIILSLLYSHKIAGPVYRLKTSSKDLLRGKKNISFKVRKKDEFQDLSKYMQEWSELYYKQQEIIEKLENELKNK